MMRSLFSGVSGLKSHQTRMDVIGNNISNINTVGFKSSRVTFSDMLSQTQTGASTPATNLGGTNPKQIGLGTAVASIDLIFSDGSPQATGKNTDVALSGNGLFVLRSGNQYYYTRDGAFEFDANGNYVLPGSGYYVQGWNAVDGSLNTNTPPTNILVPAGKTMSATASSAVSFSGNLNSGAPIITSITYTAGSNGDETTVVDGGTIRAIEYYTSSNTKVTHTLVANGVGTTISTDTSTVTPTGNTYEITTDTTVKPAVGDLYIGADGTTYIITSTDTAIPSSLTGFHTAAISYTLKDNSGNVSSGTSTVSPNMYTGSLSTTGSDKFSRTVNVDGTNVISAVLTLSDGTTQRVTSGYYQIGHSVPVTTSVSLYDSEGNTHQVTILLDKINGTQTEIDALSSAADSDTAISELDNRWVSYIAPGVGQKYPAVSYTTTEADGSTTVGTLNAPEVKTEEEYNAVDVRDKWMYTPYSVTETDGSVTTLYGKMCSIQFNQDGSYQTSQGVALTLTYSNGNGSSDTTASIDFSGLTQYSGGTTAYPTADGNAFGVLQSVAIDGAGIITGTYTNGVRRFEAQIAVAQFVNAAGLTKIGTSLYQESNNSGSANIKTVTNLGLTITPSALEMSNVDLASELADMIITQRGFQSNSKMVTVADEMLETVVNMKR